MTEINNNIPNFGHKIDKIENSNNKHKEENQVKSDTKDKGTNYIPDTGILGRSQVKNARGANISKSVDETIALAENNPVLLGCSEELFESLYKDFIATGMEPDEAYVKALLGEQELLEIAMNN